MLQGEGEKGEGVITFSIPVHTVSEANAREHWGKKARRTKQNRSLARLMATSASIPKGKAYEITMVRIGKRILDTDNLAGSMKACRDGIADALGIDDGDRRILWVYGQAIGKVYEVKVQVNVR
jgi:hypothetical protein